jgi:hypothetical protein
MSFFGAQHVGQDSNILSYHLCKPNKKSVIKIIYTFCVAHHVPQRLQITSY